MYSLTAAPEYQGVRRHIAMLNPCLLLVLMFVLAACGVSYHLEPARLTVSGSELTSREAMLDALSPLLREQGFEDLGTDEQMISLLRRTRGSDERLLFELQNRYTYLHGARDLRVEVIDFTVPGMRTSALPYDPPPGPYFELSIYEGRPSGFSAEGHAFVSLLQDELGRTLGEPVAMVTPPPASNSRAYWVTTIVNAATTVVWWTVVFLVTIFLCAVLARIALRRAPISRAAKRGIFLLAGTWLAAPLPFPAASILVVMLPNIFAFPWTNIEYYQRVGTVAALSFPIAFLLCTQIAVWVFPGTPGSTSREHRGRAS